MDAPDRIERDDNSNVVSLRAEGIQETWAHLKRRAEDRQQPVGQLAKQILDRWLQSTRLS